MQEKVRWLLLAGFAVVSLGAAIALVALPPAQAYSAAQGEAMTDPYSYPDVDLCCKPKPKSVPYCVRHPEAKRCYCKEHPEDVQECSGNSSDDPNAPNAPPPMQDVTVDCGTTYSGGSEFNSLQEAIDYVEWGGTISVRSGFPGGDCREHVHINKSVTIQGMEEGNRRTPVIINGCLTIAGEDRPRVVLNDVQILGTTTGLNGDTCSRERARYTGYDGRIHDQRIDGVYNVTALSVAGGTLVGNNVVVRSAAHALDADHSEIDLTNARLAARPDAEIAVSLEGSQARFSDVTVAGGLIGVRAWMMDRHPVNFDRVNIQSSRTQSGNAAAGDIGLIVEMVDEGLPALPGAEAESFTWSVGEIRGFKSGVVLGAGSNSSISNVTVHEPSFGFTVKSAATATLTGNRIERSRSIALSLERGALGRASSNAASYVDGDCFCSDGDCDEDDDDIKTGPYKLDGNSCQREHGRGRWF